jgi:hypothetical protein
VDPTRTATHEDFFAQFGVPAVILDLAGFTHWDGTTPGGDPVEYVFIENRPLEGLDID